MTLSIIDSMLRGDLRRHILATRKTEKEISQLWRDLSKGLEQGERNLMAIEKALISAVEESGLVLVSKDYKDDRELRQGAEQARNAGMCFGDGTYTRVDDKLCLEGLFSPVTETTPTDKYLHLLVKTECRRTMKCLLMTVQSVHDDGVIRTNVRKLFSTILSLCKDTNDTYIQESLTQFYFEVYHTFKCVLDKSSQQDYETDFENFVYEWKGEFPDKEVTARYDEKVSAFVPSSAKPQRNSEPTSLSEASDMVKEKQKDKFDKFLEDAASFTFTEMPKIKELGITQKIHKLVECMLQEKGSSMQTFGHTAAMLEFLGFRKWIAEKHIHGYKVNQYDNWCTLHIMNKSAGSSFRHYRLSVDVDPNDKQNASYKYLGWKYKQTVEEEYTRILNS